jgi:lantibiotic transport system ATP-binding protein
MTATVVKGHSAIGNIQHAKTSSEIEIALVARFIPNHLSGTADYLQKQPGIEETTKTTRCHRVGFITPERRFVTLEHLQNKGGLFLLKQRNPFNKTTCVRDLIIQTTGLCHSYTKGAPTLTDIALSVEQGQIYGFLGPNGSGKTTTLSLLLGLLPVQKGTITIFGNDIRSHRVSILQKLGSLVEAPSLYSHLTATENLEVYRTIYGVPKSRLPEVLKTVGLQDVPDKTVKRFSLGMKQRLAIAVALLPQPELLILDEPTNGLDPNGIIELRELIKTLNREQGITILVSSHILSEVEKMVTHVGIIARGQMIFQGSLPELQGLQQGSSILQIHTSNNERASHVLADYDPEWLPEMVWVRVQDRREVAAINRMLIGNDLDVFLLQPKANDLEQLFMDLTNNPV